MPDHAQNFLFDGDLGTYWLDDDVDATHPRQRVFADLAPGTYDITQALVEGWTLTGYDRRELPHRPEGHRRPRLG